MGRPKHDKYWSEVTTENDLNECKRCGHKFKGGATRIKAHLEGGRGVALCPNSIASCSTHPQEAANVTTSVDVGQEVIGASTSGSMASHINITETSLSEGVHPSHHIEGIDQKMVLILYFALQMLQYLFLIRDALIFRS